MWHQTSVLPLPEKIRYRYVESGRQTVQSGYCGGILAAFNLADRIDRLKTEMRDGEE
jgi:hypothetical protein